MSNDGNDLMARATLKRLRSSGTPINSGAIIDNYCEIEFKESLDECKTPAERKKLKKRYVEYYTKGAGKPFMDEALAKLRDYVAQAKSELKDLQEGSVKIMASNAVPAVITTGSATSVPNFAYTAIDNAQKKRTLLVLVKTCSRTVTSIVELAVLIHWTLPTEVLTLIELIGVVTKILENIPG